MKIRNISIKMIVSMMVFMAGILIASNALAVITIEDSAPGTKVSFNKGGHTDPWTGQWELLPYNVTRDTPVGATFCMQKHQALRFTPVQATQLNGYKTETIVAHSVLHSYGNNDVPATYARTTVENNIKNELNSKLTDVGWGAAEEGSGDLARYGVSNYDYEAIAPNGDIVAVSKAYSKTPRYEGQGAEVVKNTYLSYILSSGSYFHPINRFGLKKGNYAGAVSDTASGEGNAFLIQDSIWASHFNLAASNGINYRRNKPQVALDLVAEAEAYEAYTAKLNNYKATFVKTDAKVIANRTNNTYTVGPLKIQYPDDTRFSFIQEIYLIDEKGNRIDTSSLKIHTASGKAYPANDETFYLEIPGSVGDKYNKINIKVEFAYLSLTYAEYERYVGVGDIGQIIGILDSTTDTHEYKDPEYHGPQYDDKGNKTKDGWTEHFYCTRTYLTGRFEEKIVGHYDPQCLLSILTVKRQWVEDYSTTYAEKDKLIDLTTSLGGYVWVDEESGKESVFNGTYDSKEKRVPNIIVELYDEKDKKIKETKTDSKGEYRFSDLNALKKYYVTFTYNGQYYEPTTYTSPYDKNNGWGKGNWETNSNATDKESDRNSFNNKFAVIGSNPGNYDGNKETFTKMELLGYSLNEKGEYVKTNKATIDEFGNLIDGSNSKMAQYVKDSRMTAHTGFNTKYDYYPTPDIFLIDNKPVVKNTYGSMYNMRETANKVVILFPDAFYINLGLHPREITDVAVNKEVEKVTLEINNHVKEYKYDSLNTVRCNKCGFTGEISELERVMTNDFRWHTRCPKCHSEDIQANWDIQVRLSDGYYNAEPYTRKLYKADYSFKASDYGPEFEKYGVSQADELEVYVTYKIAVSNRSLSIRTRIDELVDYYDNNYELVKERSYIEVEGKKYSIVFTDKSIYGHSEDKISGLKKTYIRGIGKDDSDKELYLDAGRTANFYVTFKVLKKDGWIILDEDINTGKILEGKENIVELNGYSTRYNKGTIIPNVYDGKDGRTKGIPNNTTPAGIVDLNSNPGNQTSRTDIRENDADKAPRVRILLNRDDEGRIIEGTVWEDERTKEIGSSLIADGYMQDGEKRIDGITVQLVEIMDNPADDDHREFIWKEISSGTKTVSPVINYRNLISDYTFEDATGKYLFKSFIPGNYVIRFIYGDTIKTVAPVSLGGLNDTSYNGQDYKSTIYQNGIAQVGVYRWTAEDTFENGERKEGKLITEVPTFRADASNNETVRVPFRRTGSWNPISADDQVGYYYNDVEAKKLANVSDAKDIESRRNEVIDYSDDNVINEIAEVLASHDENNEMSKAERDALLEKLMEKTKMRAETGLMNIEIEYEESEKNVNAYTIKNVNFGLQERAKAELKIEKEVANVKVVLANGNILFDTSKQAQNVLWKENLIQLTMDEEIMHGATIVLDYNITVSNVGEVDYDDNEFYYKGVLTQEARNNKVVTTTPNIVMDYISNNLQFNKNDNRVWDVVSNKDIETKGLVKKALIRNGKLNNNNVIVVTEAFGKELAPTRYRNEINNRAQNSASVPLVLTQLITSENNTDDLTYRNIAEIVKTSNTVGRRDDKSIVGNQDPTIYEPQEGDTDNAPVVRILPPFGNVPKALIISITVMVSIVILSTGIIFIKKKVL
ncbi:MAG: hypothetical protein J6M60_02625 [Clostridia bacterium]|nr:hypothetical protein [Clostridia bacterium]